MEFKDQYTNSQNSILGKIKRLLIRGVLPFLIVLTFFQTSPAAAPATWQATSSTGCPTLSGDSSIVEMSNGDIIIFHSTSVYKYTKSTATCTSLASEPTGSSVNRAVKLTNRWILANAMGQYTALYDVYSNLWLYTFPRMIALDSNESPNSQSGSTQNIGNSITEYNGDLYILAGNAQTFEKYSPTTNTWTTLQTAPAAVGSGAAMTRIGTTIYALRGANTGDFWSYNISTNTWTNISTDPLPSSLKASAGGALTTDGTYIYALRGNSSDRLFKYNASASAGSRWSELARAPELVGGGGSLTYKSGSIYALQGNNDKNVWQYNIGTNSWSALGDFPVRINSGGFIVTDGNDLFVAPGGGRRDFYKYATSTNSWTQLRNSPTNIGTASAITAQGGAVYSSTSNNIFLSSGNGTTSTNASSTQNATLILRYSLSGTYQDTWPVYKAPASGASNFNGYGAAMAHPGVSSFDPTGDFTYELQGASGVSSALHRYSWNAANWIFSFKSTLSNGEYINNDAWFAATQSTGAQILEVNGQFYMIHGNGTNFYRYDPTLNQFTSLQSLPSSPLNSSAFIKYDDDTLFLTYSTSVFKYVISKDTWYGPSPVGKDAQGNIFDTPAALNTSSNGSKLIEIDGKIYITANNTGGGSINSMYVYNPNTNSVGQLAAPPFSAHRGSALAKVSAASGYDIYMLQGSTTKAFAKYNTESNSWTTLTSLPAASGNVESGGSLNYPGSGDYLYALIGNSTSQFWRYSISGNSWTQLASTPANVYSGGGLTSIGTIIYAIGGNGSTNFWSYDTTQTPGSDSWLVKASTPETVNSGAGITTATFNAISTIDDRIYVTAGNGTYYFFSYNPNTNSWKYEEGAPITFGTTGTSNGSGSLIYNSVDGDIYGLTANGSALGAFTTNNGTLFRYKLSSGAEQNEWVYDTGLENIPTSLGVGVSGLRHLVSNNFFYYLGINYFASFWPLTNEWLNFPKAILSNGRHILQRGYITTARTGHGGIAELNGKFYEASGNMRDFTMYDPSQNKWHALAPLPSGFTSCGNWLSIGTVTGDNDSIYVLNSSPPNVFCPVASNFIRYSVSNNSWSFLSSTPNTVSAFLMYPGAGDWIYTTSGNSPAYFTDLWRYSISKNVWVAYQMPRFDNSVAGGPDPTPFALDSTNYGESGGNTLAVANNKVYLLPGGSTTFKKFDPSNNTWTTLTAAPSSISAAAMFWNGGDVIYVVNNSSMYGYCLDTSSGCTIAGTSVSANAWTTLTAPPGAMSSGVSISSPAGSDSLYVIRGRGTTDFYRYCTVSSASTCTSGQTGNTWTSMASTSGNNDGGASSVAYGSDKIYAFQGGTTTTMRVYTISTNTWSTDNAAPATVNGGGSMVTDGTYIYATRGNATSDFWRFDPNAASGSRWSTLSSAPVTIGSSGSGGHGGYISINTSTNEIWMVPSDGSSSGTLATYSGKALLYRYKISTNEWPIYAAPANGHSNFRYSPGTSFGNDNYIYRLYGNFSPNFERYTISPDRNAAMPDRGSWTSLLQYPDSTNGPAITAIPGESNIYALKGNGTKTFARYDRSLTRKARLRGGFNASSNLSVWQAIRNGNFAITIDGTARSITGLNFSAATSLSDVASIIQTGIRTLTGGSETVYYCSDNFDSAYFVIESGTAAGGGSLSTLSGVSSAAALLTGGTNVNTTISSWSSITDGSFRISLNNDASPVNVTSINFTGVTTMAQVASTIQTRLRALTGRTETVTWTGTRFTIQSSVNNMYTSNISVLSSTGSGTDISGATRMDASTNGVVTAVSVDISGVNDQSGTGTEGFLDSDASNPQIRASSTSGDWIYCNDLNQAPDTAVGVADQGISGTTTGPLLYSSVYGELWFQHDKGGINDSSTASRLYRYSLDTDTGTVGPQGAWQYTAKPATPPTGLTTGGGGTLVAGSSNLIYATKGGATTGFYKYNVSANSWSAVTNSVPAAVGCGGSMTTDGNGNIYLTQGGTGTNLWKFDVNTESWTTQTSTPVASCNSTNTNDAKGGIVYYNNNIWFTPGIGTSYTSSTSPLSYNLLFRYDILNNNWPGTSPAASNSAATGGFSGGSDLTALNNDAIYALQGSSSTTNPNFWLYTPSTNTWAQKTSMPIVGSSTTADVQAGGSLSAGCIGPCSSYNKIFAFRGKATTNFSIYDSLTDTWTSTTGQQFPVSIGAVSQNARRGGVLYNTNSGKLYGVSGTNSTVYSLDTNGRLNISSVNSGNNIYVNTPFTVTIELVDSDGNTFNTPYDSQISIQLGTGTGVIGGTYTGTMTAGTSSLTISGVTYSVASEGNVSIKAVEITSPVNPITLSTSSNYAINVMDVPAVISNVSPSSGSTTGYESVNITGSNFRSTDTVTINNVNVSSFTYNSSTSLTILTPPSSTATSADVKVIHTDGSTGTLANGYTYSYPVVTSVTPSTGTTAGGTAVTIDGNYFSPSYYETPITINNTAATATPTDYQVKVLLNTASLISSNKLQSDCDDLRFYKSDGYTIINHWIESGCNTATTTIWIKYPDSINGSSSATTYLRYGFSSMASGSNGDNVFLFFDDFSSSTYNSTKWTSTTGTITQNSGILSLNNSGLFAGNYFIPHSVIIESLSDPTATGRIGGAIRAATTTTAGFVGDGTTNILDMLWWPTTALYAETNSGETFMGAIASGYRKYKITYRPGDVDSASYDYNNGTLTTTRTGTNASGTLHPVMFSSNGAANYDYYLIRKYFGTEPTVSIGSESTKSVSTTFENSSGTSTSYVSSTQITTNTPAHSTGYVDVSVINPNNHSGSLSRAYAYAGIFNNNNSNINGSPTNVISDGLSYSDLTITIRDDANTPLPGKVIRIYQASGAVTPTLWAVDCTNFNTIDSTAPIENTTDDNGNACFRASATTNGLTTIQATNITDSNTTLIDAETINFYELPTDANSSSFIANPTTTEPGTPSELVITLVNTVNTVQQGKTVSISHNGTSITLTPVICTGSSGTAGISDENGNICYTANSNTNQEVTFTATVVENNVTLTTTPTVNFYINPASNTYSSLTTINGGTSQEFEPIDSTIYDYSDYTEYNGAFLIANIRDASNVPIVGRSVNLTLSNALNYFVRSANCSNPRSNTSDTSSITNDYGQACFIVFNNGEILNHDPGITVTANVFNGPTETITISRGVGVSTKIFGKTYTYSYRYRNDDGSELTSTAIAGSNVPHYNAAHGQPFRLRMNITRNDGAADEFSLFKKANIGPTGFGESGPTGPFFASPSISYNTGNETIYIPTETISSNTIRIYKFAQNNISSAPTYFEIGDTNNPISSNTYIVSNSFIDSANNLLYLIITPAYDGTDTQPIKIYKINLSTESIVDILTEEYSTAPFSRDFMPNSFDSEIDLDHGFLYLTLGGEYNGTNANDTYARILKVKLNTPAAAMTKIGSLLLDRTNEIITSSVIDDTNQFMYVTYGNPQKIVKVDLDVDAAQPPVKIDEISLVPNPDQSPYEKVGIQSAVIDTVNGYAYFAGSTDYSMITDLSAMKAYITKVDISPTRTFEVISRLKVSSSTLETDNTPSGLEYFYFDPSVNISGSIMKGEIDQVNQYAYFLGSHYNITTGLANFKLIRVDLSDLTHNQIYDEINFGMPGTYSLISNLLIPQLGKGYFIERLSSPGSANVLHEYHTSAEWNFNLQSSPNVSGEYCDAANFDNYNFTDLNNSDFSFENTTNFTDNSSSSNVSGLLPDNATKFIPGYLKSNSTETGTVYLGRNNFTELEFNIKPETAAQGSYCFQLRDEDVDSDHQGGRKTNFFFGKTLGEQNMSSSDAFPPVTIGGLIFSKNEIALIEGTSTDNYGIKLASQPSTNVTVHINAGDNRLTLSPDSTPASPTETSLTFTNGNWDTYQYVTISAANNGIIDGTTNSSIAHTVVSTDASYNDIIARPVSSTVTDYGSTSANVIANVAGEITFTPPADFAFPVVNVDYGNPNFSPALALNINEGRGDASDFTITLQTTPFCKTVSVCIPLANVYLASSDLVNSFNTFSAAQIGEFVSNYLQPGSSLTDRTTYVHSNSADDKTLNNIITIFDSRAVPSGSSDNPLQGSIDLLVHLMIDYGSILTQLEVGTYTTTLTFDLNPNP